MPNQGYTAACHLQKVDSKSGSPCPEPCLLVGPAKLGAPPTMMMGSLLLKATCVSLALFTTCSEIQKG